MATADEQRLLAAAMRRLNRLESAECMDPIDTATRPTPDQQTIFNDLGKVRHRYVIAGNQSGKSQIGAREVSWLFEDNHPTWTRPARWGAEPLLIIVVGRTSKQVEENLWRKISGFVDLTNCKIVRTGGALQKVENLDNGNVILFASHHNENEAREKLQAFVAHFVWCDEMPGSFKLIEELQRRVQSRKGAFLLTCTPKVRNDQIRKMVDAHKLPLSRKYRLHMLDNPVLTDEDKADIEEECKNYTPEYRATILHGEWSSGEEAVYRFGDEHKCDPDQARYSKGWRHVLSVDPAMASKLGYTLWAEDPATNKWYCIRAEYISNIAAPDDYVLEVEQAVRGYNIVRRVCDTTPWYRGAASKLGYTYISVFNKTQRKEELIKNLQTSLDKQRIGIATWCEDFIDEFITCQWSETVANKIVGSQRFHLLDSAQYFNDLIPKPDPLAQCNTHADRMIEAHNRRKIQEHNNRITKGGRLKRRKQWKRSQGGLSLHS